MAPEVGAGGGRDEAVLGKPVDVAHFLCKHSKPGDLTVSESTWSQASEISPLSMAEQRELAMSTDNMTLMAYILAPEHVQRHEQVIKQCRHILGAEGAPGATGPSD